MTDLPDPIVPIDCDIRGMPYMPLDLIRLFDSDFYVLSTGEEFKAGLSLWCKAFLQNPAGSLPSDERLLAHLSGAGSRWKQVREMALHGWFQCNDGRLYHKVVAEKVADAWKARCEKRSRTEAARAARAEQRAKSDSGSTPPVANTATSSTSEDVTTSVTENATGHVTRAATDSVADTEAIDVTSSKTKQNKTKEASKKEDTVLRTDAVASISDAKAELWAKSLDALRLVTGLDDRKARPLLGMLRKTAKDDHSAVLKALRSAIDIRPSDPVAWLKKAVEPKAQAKPGGISWIGSYLSADRDQPDFLGETIITGETIQ